MSDTYKDGVQMERCLFCGSAIRLPSNEPVVSILISDVEAIACILEQYVDCPAVWGDTIKRLEQACGRTVRQIALSELSTAEAEAVPDAVKLDRGGLPLEEA